MKDPDLQNRFDELDAGRALGDLTPEEHEELAKLIKDEQFETDGGLDWLAAGVEASHIDGEHQMSAEFQEKLIANAEQFTEAEKVAKVETIPFWKNPLIGWAAAACLALAFLIPDGEPDQPISAADARQALIQGNQAVQIDFKGTDNYTALAGDIVWSDSNQEGYMTFSGIAANDPSQKQYQLWIVDPKRDTAPVDGGVFDIPAGGGPVVIPIRAALNVNEPTVFVVTLEQPGGVVVSKQEQVVAIASRG